jgi:very-short-patch-repair endonuclease
VHEASWQRASDQDRSAYLHEHGIRVIRFENRAVFEQLIVVLEAIAWHFKDNNPQTDL